MGVFDSNMDEAWAELEHHLQGLNEVVFDGNVVSVADMRIILDGWPTPRLQELYDGKMDKASLEYIRPYMRARLVNEMMNTFNALD